MAEDGVKKTNIGREYFYTCDLAPQGGGKMRQSRLSSFVKTSTKRQEDTVDRELGNDFLIDTPTEGKNQ